MWHTSGRGCDPGARSRAGPVTVSTSVGTQRRTRPCRWGEVESGPSAGDDDATILPASPPRAEATAGRYRSNVLGLALALFVLGAFTLTAGAQTSDRQADSAIPAELVPFLVDDDGLTPISVDPRARTVGLDGIVVAAVGSLTAFWGTELVRLYGVEFGPRPALAPYIPSTGRIPPCGDDLTVSLATRQAFYCTAGDYIGWDAEFLFPETYTAFHALAPAVILAHEWAHAAQARADVVSTALVSELQADCFAGAWLAASTDPIVTELRSDFLDRAPRFFAWIGDPHDGEVGDQDRHGRAGERQAAFGDGYRRGAIACAVLAAPAFPDVDPAAAADRS